MASRAIIPGTNDANVLKKDVISTVADITGIVEGDIHPDLPGFGASPDGLVNDDGLLEIKCPNTATHIDFLRTGKPDGRYLWQMEAQMACTGRDWCDFVSYDDRMPEWAQYKRVRIGREQAKAAEMLAEIKVFLEELAELEAEILKMKGAA